MKSLLQRLFGRRNKAEEVRTRIDADKAKPFFSSLGVDIETIGFPHIETRHLAPLMKYWVDFDDIKVTPVNIGGIVKTIINGTYEIQAMASGRDRSGRWYPGNPTKYSFIIEDGRLKLRRQQ